MRARLLIFSFFLCGSLFADPTDVVSHGGVTKVQGGSGITVAQTGQVFTVTATGGGGGFTATNGIAYQNNTNTFLLANIYSSTNTFNLGVIVTGNLNTFNRQLSSTLGASVDYQAYILYDTNQNPSVDWKQRKLVDSNGGTALNWDTRTLLAPWIENDNFTVQGTFFTTSSNFFSKPVVIGTNIAFNGYGLTVDGRNASVPPFEQIIANVGSTASLDIGDVVGQTTETSFQDNGLGVSLIQGGSANTTMNFNLQNAGANFNFQKSAVNMMSIGATIAMNTNVAIGAFAGNAVTVNGNAWAIPNNWFIGSGDLTISNHNIGIGGAGAMAPTNSLFIDGTAQRQIFMGAAAQFVNGNPLTIKAGNVNTTASTNLTGGTLFLQGGAASGTASSAVEIDVASVGGSGTTVHQPNQIAVFKNTGAVIGSYASPSAFLDVGQSTLGQSDAFRLTMGVSSLGNILNVTTSGIVRVGMTTGDIMVSNANWTTPIASTPAINQIFTNVQRRGYISADILFSDTTGLARVKLMQVTGAVTNILCDRQVNGAVNADILGVNGYINPASILCFSNFSTGDGTVSVTNFNSIGF